MDVPSFSFHLELRCDFFREQIQNTYNACVSVKLLQNDTVEIITNARFNVVKLD